MNKLEATQIWEKYYKRKKLDKDEEKLYLEALEFLIKEKDYEAAHALGYYYAKEQRYDLAEKYFKEAIKGDNKNAYRDLAYLYYNGKINNEIDYINAAKYFDLASNKGSIDAEIKLAEMYIKGQGVRQDVVMAFELLQSAKKKALDLKENRYLYLPEINILLVSFYAFKNDVSSIIEALYEARKYLITRIIKENNLDDLDLMKTIIDGLFKYDTKIKNDECLYNLFNYLNEDGKYKFKYNDKKYVIYCDHENNSPITFEDKLFDNPIDFFENAKINDKNIYLLINDCILL